MSNIALDISKINFVFKSSSLWNCLIGDNFERSSLVNSDFCATVPFIKNKLKVIFLNQLASGDIIKWVPENSIKYSSVCLFPDNKLISW